MVSVQQPVQDDNSETYVRLWSSVCVVRNELTEMWVSEARQSEKMIIILWQ